MAFPPLGGVKQGGGG